MPVAPPAEHRSNRHAELHIVLGYDVLFSLF